MSDWKPGDLALCVRGGAGKLYAGKCGGEWRREGDGALRKGATYIVRKIRFTDDGDPYLGLIGVDGPWMANRFQKQRPHTPDEQDAETIRLLTGVPVKEPGHA